MKIVPEITRKSITELINDGERPDGRALEEYRNISLETNVISKAQGSARVKIGNTQVIAGIKYQIGTPFPDTPDVGVIMTNAELLPMAAPDFEPGPPDEKSIELARVVDRCIRESEMVNLKELCISEGKQVFMIFIDLHIIDYDGNLFDAAALAAVSALSTTKLPSFSFDEDEELVLSEECNVQLPMTEKALLCTFVKIGDNLVLDPSLEEEEILEARLNIGITESGNICAMQKGGVNPLSKDEIIKAVRLTQEKTEELFEFLPSTADN